MAFAPIAAARGLFIRTFVFDDNDRNTFLSIIAAQLRGKRNLPAIFEDLQKDANKEIAKIARHALSPGVNFFAEGLEERLGRRRAQLLVLAQRYSALEPFIRELVNRKRPWSLFKAIVTANILEWLMTVVLIAGAIALYIQAPVIAETLIDLSGTRLAKTGGNLLVYGPPGLGVAAAIAAVYVYIGGKPGETREALAKAGCYKIRDAETAIDVFTTLGLLCRSALVTGAAPNMPALFRELGTIFANDTNSKAIFRRIQLALSAGQTVREAIIQSKILPPNESRLYHGMTRNNTLGEHAEAATMVAEQLELRTTSTVQKTTGTISLLLYAVLGIMIVISVDTLMGAGVAMEGMVQ